MVTKRNEKKNEVQNTVDEEFQNIETHRLTRLTPKPLTRLEGKHYSPLVMRKYTRWGCPLFVALITDDDLNNLDEVVTEFMQERLPDSSDGQGWKWPSSLQGMRDIAGALTEEMVRAYDKVEGAAVVLSADKMLISSLFGDFMTHHQCKAELLAYLQLSTQI